MRRFELAEPQTLEEACALLSDDGDAKALAGGTALLTLIKHGIFIPKTLVNLKKIGGMSGIARAMRAYHANFGGEPLWHCHIA